MDEELTEEENKSYEVLKEYNFTEFSVAPEMMEKYVNMERF
jgi:hypothetical protein